MTSPSAPIPAAAEATTEESAIQDFQRHLARSTRILALCGAGLSAASGLPTFRGAGGMWKNHESKSLATPEAFEEDPGLVWQFYSYRRHMALVAEPNPAHFALAELARRKPGFLTLSQNVDGLSPRANHPPSQLKLLHGNLFDVKCFNENCNYLDANNLTDPIVPALAVSNMGLEPSPADKTGATASSSLKAAMEPHSTDDNPFSSLPPINNLEPVPSSIPINLLPACPKCKTHLLRPGVVWFGEALPFNTVAQISTWIRESPTIDLIMVIGTTAAVYPAAGYIARARLKGARVAVVNIDADDLGATKSLTEKDWMFVGDAGVLLPKLFANVEGE